jgi:hypothetical protein
MWLAMTSETRMTATGPVRPVALIVLAVVTCGGGAGNASIAAQSVNARLAAAKTLVCTFPVVATGNWIDGAHHADVKPSKLTIEFGEIDRDDGTARVIGDFGPSEIIVRSAGDTLHFVQSFREGPLYFTTVYPTETHDGRVLATHSRHEYTAVQLPGFTSRPEQYYGDCDIRP